MTVFVTGASAGFGAAITKKFVTEGHRVVASGRRQERLKALVGELATDRLHTLVLDVRDRPAVEHAVSALPAEFAEIDVVVNNAGLALGLEPAHKADIEAWEQMVDNRNRNSCHSFEFHCSKVNPRTRSGRSRITFIKH